MATTEIDRIAVELVPRPTRARGESRVGPNLCLSRDASGVTDWGLLGCDRKIVV